MTNVCTYLKDKVFLKFFAILLICGSCQLNGGDKILNSTGINVQKEQFDLAEIKKRGKIIALTGNNYRSYFIYRGAPMGYEFELLQKLASELNVKLEIKVVKNLNEIYTKLNNGEGDIVADNLAITKALNDQIAFTGPIGTSRQVLIQRATTSNFPRQSIIRNPIDLIGKKIYIRKETAFYHRLQNLSSELGGDIEIVEVPGEVETEELIKKVSTGEIDFTIADEQMAQYAQTLYSNLDISTPISFPQRMAWAVRSNSPELLNAVNLWIRKTKNTSYWYAVYNKYYKSSKTTNGMINCSRYETCGTQISPYDKLIIRAARKIDWDWRLLTSLIYQESRFNPQARSWAGAMGLMQLMPQTATGFGVTDPDNPRESIAGGIKYIQWLDNYWKKKVPDKEERIKFILASYNIGQEHIADARRLAEKYGQDPNKWEKNVASFLILKAKEKYNTDPVVKFGYCRGEFPVQYVDEVLERYDHYKKLIRHDIYLATVKREPKKKAVN